MFGMQKFTGLALNIASDLAVSLKKDLAAAAEISGNHAQSKVTHCGPSHALLICLTHP